MITSIKRSRIFSFNEDVGSLEILDGPLAWVPRLGSITPLHWICDYGLRDDPVDEFVEWILLMCDVDNLPTIDSCRARALWHRAQNWRSIGTDSGPIQTMTKDDVDWLNPETYGTTEFADFTQRLAMVVVVEDTSATSTVNVLGVLTYREDLIQRVFGNDNWTFNDPDDSEFGQDWGMDAGSE